MRKVLWTCAELQVDFHHDQHPGDSDLGNGVEQGTLNPNQLVPVLIDDDLVFWESNTIIRYLAGTYGGSHLLPESPKSRASIEKWIDWQASELNPAWSYAFQTIVRRNPEQAEATRLQGSLRRWAEKMDILEVQLQATERYIAGECFSLADIPVGLFVNR